MTIAELQAESYITADKHGWHGRERSPLEVHALIHSEISEATEAVRNNFSPIEIYRSKPQGELIELADAIIRIADYCEERSWDLTCALRLKLDYNKTRSFRHGDKRY